MGVAVAKQDYQIVDALNVEWHQLSAGQSLPVRRWAARHPALRSCASLGDVLQATGGDPDAAMSALLAERSAGDQLAGRVVLQAMLGKVVKMAGTDPYATADDYVAAMWCQICTYPLSRRPAKIAANLALDVLKTVTAERHWVRHGSRVAVVSHEAILDQICTAANARMELDHGSDLTTLTAAHVVEAAGRLGLIDESTRHVLLSVYADGLSGSAAADRHQTTPAMVRFRCSRAVRRLAQHSASLAAAA